MKAYLKDVLEFAATVFCVTATNAIILFRCISNLRNT